MSATTFLVLVLTDLRDWDGQGNTHPSRASAITAWKNVTPRNAHVHGVFGRYNMLRFREDGPPLPAKPSRW